jgi:gamma-F420-2:alpha-L-glutamate ligase
MIDTSNPLLLQEFIENSKGKDIRVFVVGRKVIGAMMRISKKGFKSNFHQGGFVKPYEVDEKLEKIALSASNALNLEIAGVDVLIDHDGYKICEVNSSPGYEAFEMSTGVNIPKKILEYCIEELKNKN